MQVLNDFKTSLEKALSEIDPKWRDYDGLVICGTHSQTNVEAMITLIHEARETGRPFLGICAGYQLACIEYCRAILGIEDATSEEFGVGTFVIKKRPELKVGLHDGETWWSNYELDEKYQVYFPKNFICTAFHPEYQSSRELPHPILVDFINLCKNHEMAN